MCEKLRAVWIQSFHEGGRGRGEGKEVLQLLALFFSEFGAGSANHRSISTFARGKRVQATASLLFLCNGAFSTAPLHL